VEAVTGWTEREFPGELRAGLVEFVGERREITEDEENWAAAWFLHDRELPGGGTPLERYATAGSDPRLREAAEAHAGAKLRFWRVLESWPGERLLVEPFVGGGTVAVESRNISRNVGRWDIILGRLNPDSSDFWGPVKCYAADDEEDLRHLLAQFAHRLKLDQDDPDRIARHAPAAFLWFEPRPLVPVTTEGDPVVVVNARWRVGRESAAVALLGCRQCLDDGGGSFTWIRLRERLVALQPDPMPTGAALVEISPVDIPGVVSLGQFSLERDLLRYEGLSERRLAWAIEFVADVLPDATLLDSAAQPAEQAFAKEKARTRKRPKSAHQPPLEVIAAARTEMTERWLSDPVPALEGLTPRQAAAQSAYLPQLRAILRSMESSARKMGERESYPIDLDAVITELGIGP